MGSKVSVEFEQALDYPYPTANVCIFNLCLPICHHSYEAFQKHMDEALQNGYLGFGLQWDFLCLNVSLTSKQISVIVTGCDCVMLLNIKLVLAGLMHLHVCAI